MCSWIKKNRDLIDTGVGVAGLLIAVVGFALTIWQLRDATIALQAANTYEIQKDARETLEKLGNDTEFRAFVRGQLNDPAKENDQLDKLWLVLNFYKSVYRQNRAGGLTPEFARSFAKDFCDFVAYPGPASGWEKFKEREQLGTTHEQMRKEWCP